MDDLWSLLAAAGVAGAIAGFVSQIWADATAGRRQRRQMAHEDASKKLEREHQMVMQEDERRHQATLRAEAAHAEAASWSVPLVAHCLYWVELEREANRGIDVSSLRASTIDASVPTEATQVLRAMFRLATEHPTEVVRTHAKEVYGRMRRYYGPANEDDSPFSTTPTTDDFESWLEYLEWLLPYVHRRSGSAS